MRKAKGIAAIFAGLLLMFRAGAITVSADEGKNGNNGDVKIHAVGTATADNRNEPHVCDFYIDGFKFDKLQSGTWVIVGQAPTAGNAGTSGAWGPAAADGSWQAPVSHLADGHYKLTVNTGKGDGKHKVFWVECGTTANGPANTPPPNGGQQNNGNNKDNGERTSVPTNSKSKNGGSKSGTNSKSKKGGTATGTKSASKASKNTKGGTQAGSVTGTHSVSKAGTKAGGTKGTNGGSVASQGNNASGTNSLQTISREETGGTNTGGTNTGGTNTGGTNTGGTNTGGTNTGATPNSVLGFESAPAMTGAVTPELENAAAAASQGTAVNGEETSPVAGVTSLPSTSTALDNGIWGALGLMLAGLGAFLLRKPQRRLN